uniref:Endonuclease/exonuclease/phosphatase domain-containing protein n=1 Tax=Romanomermis culicivorax TaxID=13658 RepID=A0A915IP34_ROMCU
MWLKRRNYSTFNTFPNIKFPVFPSGANPVHSLYATADLQALIKDALEVETKKANAVLFGLPVNNTIDDLAAVCAIVEKADNEDVGPEDITRVFRDGPTYDDKPHFLKVCCNNNYPTFIFGDFNEPNINWLDPDPNELPLVYAMYQNGLTQ